MTAGCFQRLLAYRHAGDVYIPECKMGSAGSRSLDGWALLPTWSPLTAIGYEIKISRSDWLQDQKFEEYRSCCHLFFVVAPVGVVDKKELPPGVGLLEPIGKEAGQRLVMRAKAVRHNPDAEKLVRLMAYALMWKRAGGDPDDKRARRAAFWENWVAEEKRFSTIGGNVKGRMRKILAEAIEQRDLAVQRSESLAEAEALLKELGVRAGAWSLRREIDQALNHDREAVRRALESARSSLTEVLKRLDSVAPVVGFGPDALRVPSRS